MGRIKWKLMTHDQGLVQCELHVNAYNWFQLEFQTGALGSEFEINIWDRRDRPKSINRYVYIKKFRNIQENGRIVMYSHEEGESRDHFDKASTTIFNVENWTLTPNFG